MTRPGVIGAALVMAAGAVVFLTTASRALLYDPQQEIAPPAAVAFAASQRAADTPAGEYPARVAIPTLGIDTNVQSLGLVAGNRMRAPSNFTDVGWFKYGVVPGQPGTAVMYGHLDNGLGLAGVFLHLDKLALDDPITVTTADGTKLAFKVTNIETYPYLSVPDEELGQGTQPAGARITLITCSGNPINDKNEGFTYDHRLVVTATYIGKS